VRDLAELIIERIAAGAAVVGAGAIREQLQGLRVPSRACRLFGGCARVGELLI